ncbi:hypothetical protein [Streptomyces sp. NPDC051909]|uniref:hypothetical protein n=1 Tax=Streptomyces sp. NPDC051909 TaxID=3154944 RepID=UPI003446F956
MFSDRSISRCDTAGRPSPRAAWATNERIITEVRDCRKHRRHEREAERFLAFAGIAAATAMVGPAQNRYADPAAWDRLHEELGIRLPTDYQTLVDAYAPIRLNGHLYPHHPATERRNLGQDIRDTVRPWSEASWEDLDPDQDPCLLLGLTELSLGTRNGLWPIASTDRGETLFLMTADDTAP